MKTNPHENRLVSYHELRPLFGIPYSRVHLRTLESRGSFPRHVQLSTNRIAWRASDLERWIEVRAERQPA